LRHGKQKSLGLHTQSQSSLANTVVQFENITKGLAAMLMLFPRANTFTKNVYTALYNVKLRLLSDLRVTRHIIFKTAVEYTESTKQNSLALKIVISGST
jgi:hypothetical protein